MSAAPAGGQRIRPGVRGGPIVQWAADVGFVTMTRTRVAREAREKNSGTMVVATRYCSTGEGDG
jgi:hypothetical protein